MKELNNWREEQRSAYLYQVISKHEINLKIKNLFLNLAETAKKQAKIWERELSQQGYVIQEQYTPDIRARFVSWLLNYFRPKQLRFMLSALKIRGLSVYDTIVLQESMTEDHKKIMHESNHLSVSTVSNLRAAVFGINDGLISNMCLLMGIVGGTNDTKIILLSGVAGLLAGAFSMAAGEYVSMQSQKDFFAYQIKLEQEELFLYPEEEAAELSLIYQARGVPESEANELANNIITNPHRALDVLAREELGLNKNDLGSPVGAAISSFSSFAIGATIPLLPFLCFEKFDLAIPISIGLTAGSLFVVGAMLSLFTNKNIFLCGMRMLCIGASAGLVTYFIGKIITVGLF